MKRVSWLPVVSLVSSLAAGCGVPQAEFVPAYNEALCNHILACGDAAQNRFDGLLSLDECVDDTRNDVVAWGVGCRYRGGQAQQCLADMETLACPGGGGTAPIPASCNEVYVNCGEITDTDGGGGDTSDSPADSPADTDVDTDA